MQSTLHNGELLDRVRRWQGDLVCDATPDQVVQAAIAFAGGGTAVFLAHWVFEGRGQDFVLSQTMDLPGGIRSARRDGATLVLQLYKEIRLPLN